MNDAASLSSSLEDYLEVILHLVSRNQVARVKDIAKQIQVKNSSVTGALRVLAGKGLIHYSPYNVVTLTERGEEAAKDVAHRHQVLRDFFVNILAVNPAEADVAACRIEHCISPEILERFVLFSALQGACVKRNALWAEGEVFRCCQQKDLAGKPSCGVQELQAGSPPKSAARVTLLSDLKPGEKGRIARVKACGEIRKRLLEMGFVTGAQVEVERFAPLGDPIEVIVKGCHLTLRRSEAQSVEIAVELPSFVADGQRE
jgi:DtxR family Mn-dependent transcriptional regulator